MSGMLRFEIVVRSLGPLLMGGQSGPARGGDKASARDLDGRPMIPASALRGALRIELERLLRGLDGDRAVCGPNMPPEGATAGQCDCPVCRLFGAEGYGIGTLRLDDAHLADAAVSETSIRPHVAVSRRSGTAVSGHLAILEATVGAAGSVPVFRAQGRLAPRSPEDDVEALADDLANLRAACSALTALGGGKARGFGWVECSMESETVDQEAGATNPPPAWASGQTSGALRLVFEAEAPLHFGRGRPVGGFLPTRGFAPGSTVRGAIAFALLEQGLCSPEDGAFQALTAGAAGDASFGAARAAGDRPLATRRKCRPNDHVFDDLVAEVVRRQAAREGIALAFGTGAVCPRSGCGATKLSRWAWADRAPQLDRRVRTRTAVNRRTGTAMDQKLYSVEVLEPRMLTEGDDDRQPLTLTAELHGLPTECVDLLAGLHHGEIWLGGRRSRGMGRCRVRIEAVREPDVGQALHGAEVLTRRVTELWDELRGVVGDGLAPFLSDEELLFAIVLDEPWLPEEGADVEALGAGPLGGSTGPASGPGVHVSHRFLELTEEGRFGAPEAQRFGAPDRVRRGELVPLIAAAPGSVFVHRIERPVLEERLSELLALGRRGSGVQRELGWGRFAPWVPEETSERGEPS